MFRARPAQPVPFAVRVVLYGVVTGVVAAVVSAPVVAYLFGGVTGSGSAFIVALFLEDPASNLLNAVLLSGLTADPIDKIAAGADRGAALPRDAGGLHRHGPGTGTPARA